MPPANAAPGNVTIHEPAAPLVAILSGTGYSSEHRGRSAPLGSPEAALNMTTATAVLATLPASYRVKRHQVGGGEQQLRYLDQQAADFTVKQLAYGVLYADSTGRTIGSVSMALRRSTPWQVAQLVAAMRKDGIELIADVSRWLNANALAVLA
jgi:hypothetical protein